MEIAVTNVQDLPANTYISIRHGDMRRQAPFRKGEKFSFPSSPDKAYTVDVFRKLASKHVSLAGISALGGMIVSEDLVIPSLTKNEMPVIASLSAALSDKPQTFDGTEKMELAQRAKNYLDEHDVQTVLQGMFTQLLQALPGDPIAFMCDYLEGQHEDDESGDESEIGFAAHGGPEHLPDLSRHHSLTADVLKEKPELYSQLRSERTVLGVSLADCLKTCIDNPGHPIMKVEGFFAGDAESYDLFQDVFDPVICAIHGVKADMCHHTDTNSGKLSRTRIDPTGRYGVSACIETRRNFNAIPFPPVCSLEELREVECLAIHAFGSFEGDLQGAYHTLKGSESHLFEVDNMTIRLEKRLDEAGLLPVEPDSRRLVAAGFARHWPEGRGVFLNTAENLCIWCNEEDHLRLFADERSVDLVALWRRIHFALSSLQKANCEFAVSKRLGYCTASPSRLGTALKVTVLLKIPLLGGSKDLQTIAASRRLYINMNPSVVDTFCVSNMDCLGMPEVDILNAVIEGCSELVRLEQQLERGEAIFNALPGLGEFASPGFPHDTCPIQLPDMTQCKSLAAMVLKTRPEVYKQLCRQKTSLDTGFAICIKPTMDRVCSEAESGLVCGDEESFTRFHHLFSPVIHHLFDCELRRPSFSTAVGDVSRQRIDASLCYSRGVRVDFRRNLRGLRFTPSCGIDERREVERLLVRSLCPSGLGEYYPLQYSESYVPMPGGTSEIDHTSFFPAPSQPLQLSAGVHRHWPDARGVFVADRETSFHVLCNEEDHLHIVSVRDDDDLMAAFSAAVGCLRKLHLEVHSCGYEFAQHESVGHLTVRPENFGGIQCAVTLQLPHLAARADFMTICKAFQLKATARGNVTELVNFPNFESFEDDYVVKVMIEGCSALVELELQLGFEPSEDEIQEELRKLGVVPGQDSRGLEDR